MSSAVTIGLAYLLGSFPAGFLVGRMRGVDIRQVGSGNIGATNAFRALGKPAGIVVLLIDASKGYVSVIVVPLLVFRWFGMTPSAEVAEYYAILSAFSAVLGHNYTCWLGFKGGKGIATSAGVLLALVPVAFSIILGVFLLMILWTRYVSVGSICAAIALPVSTICLGRSPALVGVSLAMGVLAVYKHRSNIVRLMNGTESRIKVKGKGTEQ